MLIIRVYHARHEIRNPDADDNRHKAHKASFEVSAIFVFVFFFGLVHACIYLFDTSIQCVVEQEHKKQVYDILLSVVPVEVV